MTTMSHAQRAERRRKIAEFCKAHPVGDAITRFGVSGHTVMAACAEHGVHVGEPGRMSHADRVPRPAHRDGAHRAE